MREGKLGKIMLDGTMLAEKRDREARDQAQRKKERMSMVGVARRAALPKALGQEPLPKHPRLREVVERWKSPAQQHADERERVKSGELPS